MHASYVLQPHSFTPALHVPAPLLSHSSCSPTDAAESTPASAAASAPAANAVPGAAPAAAAAPEAAPTAALAEDVPMAVKTEQAAAVGDAMQAEGAEAAVGEKRCESCREAGCARAPSLHSLSSPLPLASSLSISRCDVLMDTEQESGGRGGWRGRGVG